MSVAHLVSHGDEVAEHQPHKDGAQHVEQVVGAGED